MNNGVINTVAQVSGLMRVSISFRYLSRNEMPGWSQVSV
jgi:hypothetical protein